MVRGMEAGALPRHASLQEWINATALNFPDQPAVTESGRTLCYRDLRHAAQRLGHKLQQHGAQANTLVAVYSHRSIEMIVGVVAVLYSGAAYLPLNTNLAPQELREAVATAHPVAAVVTSPMLESFKRVFGASLPFECIECDDAGMEGGGNGAGLPAEAAPDHAAYAIFTSGSTGKPKCVVQRHE